MKAVCVDSPSIPGDVARFAAAKGVQVHLNAAIELARQSFPAAPLSIALGQDAEDLTHQYIALDVDVNGKSADELLAGQRTWTAGIGRVCPSSLAVYFVLGWR